MSKPINWRQVRTWLEAGHTLAEISEYFEVGKCVFRRRANRELPEDVRYELSRLARRNARWAYKGGPPKCGTMRGYHAHREREEMVCTSCNGVASEYRRNREHRNGRRNLSQAAKERYEREGFPWGSNEQRPKAEERKGPRGSHAEEAEPGGSLGG